MQGGSYQCAEFLKQRGVALLGVCNRARHHKNESIPQRNGSTSLTSCRRDNRRTGNGGKRTNELEEAFKPPLIVPKKETLVLQNKRAPNGVPCRCWPSQAVVALACYLLRTLYMDPCEY